MPRKIFIGRNPSSDCVIPQTFNKVSNNHAEIEENNGRLFFIDHSSNGTLINGQLVFNNRVEISEGDDIRLANSYSLTWSEICRFFPKQYEKTYPMMQERGGRKTQLYDSGEKTKPYSLQSSSYAHSSNQREKELDDYDYQTRSRRHYLESEIRSWNWGAFLLGWIWAVGHSIVWPLFAVLGTFLIFVMLPCLFPPIMLITVPIHNILLLALSIYLGAKGSSMAWDNGCFESIEQFRAKERNWTIAGLIVWGIGLLLFIISIIIWFSAIASLLASF